MIILVIAAVILIFIDYILYYFDFIRKVKRYNMFSSYFGFPVIDIPDKLRGRIRLCIDYSEFLRFSNFQIFSCTYTHWKKFDTQWKNSLIDM